MTINMTRRLVSQQANGVSDVDGADSAASWMLELRM
jgi:hypothetical protein